MIETTYTCDLCKRKSATVRQWHAKRLENSDTTLNYSSMDVVPFPPGWKAVGNNIVCDECIVNLKDAINPLTP